MQLHPYQLQALRFMLDRETRDPEGLASLLWLRQPLPGGATAGDICYSPVLRRVVRGADVRPLPAGGLLCEEMGCGKTVEVLGLVLANPAPPMPAGVHKDEEGLIKSR